MHKNLYLLIFKFNSLLPDALLTANGNMSNGYRNEPKTDVIVKPITGVITFPVFQYVKKAISVMLAGNAITAVKLKAFIIIFLFSKLSSIVLNLN